MNKIISTIIVIVVCIFAFLSGTGYEFDNNTNYGKFLNSLTSSIRTFVHLKKGVSCDSVEVKSSLSKIYFGKKIEELPQGFTFIIDKTTTLSKKDNGKVCQAAINVDLSDELISKIVSDIDSGKMLKKIQLELVKEAGLMGSMYAAYNSIGISIYLKQIRNILIEDESSTEDSDVLIKYQITVTDDGKSVLVKVIEDMDEENKSLLELLNLVAELSQS